ncbi:MAG: penicillin-binding protein 2 [Desulfamplus sp.]|nr:penicillin-binding protein 2 [Desulfamplus sp.]
MAAEKHKNLVSAVEKQRYLNFRITVIQWLFLFVVALLAIKAVDIQIFKSTDLTMKAEKEYIKTITVEGKRGDIMDRNRKRLTTTIDTVSVAAIPSAITNPAETASKLATILKIDKKRLQEQLSTKKNFAWVKRKISPAEADKIKQLKLKGIFFQDDVIRFHPNRELAAQVIGITGSDSKGLEGLEFSHNSLLEGRNKKIKITKDAAGRYYNEEKNIRESLKGDSLVLTIDSTIQFISENALQKAVEDNSAISGTAIVMKPDTGEILAMAHYPTFNPNSFADFDRSRWRNRAVLDSFEPGSTMKVFVAAAVIEHKYVNPKSLFYCEKGLYRVGGSTVKDTHSYEWLTVKEIIKYSSNIGTIKLSELMGKKMLFDTLSSFGFGKKSGIGLPGDSSGTLSDYKRWSKIDTAAISFGQGMATSSLQLITGISAIANGGLLVKPRIIKEILSPNGEVKKEFKTEPVKQAISKETAQIIRDMMRSVVEPGGTGTNAAIEGYSVCGKTGTAQKASKTGGYSKDKYTALFVGFAPQERAQLVVLVVVDEPPRSHYGGVVAAPAVKSIMSESFNYLKIPPDMPSLTATPISSNIVSGSDALTENVNSNNSAANTAQSQEVKHKTRYSYKNSSGKIKSMETKIE